MLGLPSFLGMWSLEDLHERGGQLMQTASMRHMKAGRVNQVKMTQFSTHLFNELLQVIFSFCYLWGFPLLNVTTATVV